MTLFLITVGVSVRDRTPNGDERLFALGRAVDADEPESVAEFLQRLAARDPDTVAAAERTCDDADLRTWARDASAERTTLRVETGQATVGPDDRIVLVASDTGPGLLAAFWNAALFTDGALDKVRYLDDPDGHAPHGQASSTTGWLPANGGVAIVRIRNLDLRRSQDAPLAMRRLGILGRRILDGLGDDEEIEVHLSGGYKATIPFMLGIAEGLRSVNRNRPQTPPTVRAKVLHEDSLNTAAPRTVDIPLRRFSQDLLSHLHYRFPTLDPDGATFTRKRSRVGDALEGYAYEPVDDGRWRLTPFGEGLRALVDRQPGAFG